MGILPFFGPIQEQNSCLHVGFYSFFVGSEGTPDSVNPSVVDEEEEEGLPSPPMDEAFFAAQTGSMELSQVLLAYPSLPFLLC